MIHIFIHKLMKNNVVILFLIALIIFACGFLCASLIYNKTPLTEDEYYDLQIDDYWL
jgi:hypothetical protein